MTVKESRIQEISQRVAERIHAAWDEIEMEAGMAGQSSQDTDAEIHFAVTALSGILEEEFKVLVLECAKVADQRSEVADYPTAIRCEARKCADQIRHNMLAVTGKSHVCYYCDGDGCKHCRDGIVVMSRFAGRVSDDD